MAEFIKHTSCDVCNSSDAKAIYADGGSHCFSCNNHTFPNTTTTQTTSNMIIGEFTALVKRHITLDTCKIFGYQVVNHIEHAFSDEDVYKGPAQVANYYKNGKQVAQKFRTPDKRFWWQGTPNDADFFGSQLWGNGKKLVITEGEIDAMSVSQVQGNSWPVISLKDGAQSAEKSIKKHLDYFNNFEEIILMFDMDEAGQKAAVDVAKLLPIGKVSIAALPMKDANEMLVEGKDKDLLNAVWRAKPYSPAGLLSSDDLLKEILTFEFTKDANYPWPLLNHILYGLRKPELVLIGAGTGIGKSTFTRQLAYHLITKDNKRVGFITLEQHPAVTAVSLIGLALNKRLNYRGNGIKGQEALIEKTYNELFKDKLRSVKHFGSIAGDELTNLIRYMVVADGCDYIILDHLTLAAMPESGESDERLAIDRMVVALKRLVEELNFGLICISHTKRLHGNKGHEDGEDVLISHLRGSSSIGQLPDVVIALNGSNTGEKAGYRQLVVLKNRNISDLGPADVLKYNKETGHLEADLTALRQENGDFE